MSKTLVVLAMFIAAAAGQMSGLPILIPDEPFTFVNLKAYPSGNLKGSQPVITLATIDVKPSCNVDMFVKNRTEAARAVMKAHPGALQSFKYFKGASAGKKPSPAPGAPLQDVGALFVSPTIEGYNKWNAELQKQPKYISSNACVVSSERAVSSKDASSPAVEASAVPKFLNPSVPSKGKGPVMVVSVYNLKPGCNVDMFLKNRTEATLKVFKAHPGVLQSVHRFRGSTEDTEKAVQTPGLTFRQAGSLMVADSAEALVKFSTELNKMPKYIASNACLVNVERAVGREA